MATSPAREGPSTRPRFELAWSAAAAVLAVVLCFVPLVNLLGYEFAEAFCLFATISTAAIAIKRLSDGTVDPGRDGVGQVAVSLIARGLMVLVLPLTAILLNALRVANCDPLTGLLLYLLLPGCTVPVVVAMVMALSAPFRSLAPRIALYALVVLVSAATTAWHLLVQPPIYAFHPTLGYIAGSIYDEALSIPDGLVAFRLMCLALVAAVLAGLDLGYRRRARRSPWPALMTLALAVTLWTVLHVQRFELRIEASRADIIEALGGVAESEHFLVYYPVSDLRIARNIQAIVDDHEFRYHRYATMLGVEPELPVRSFIYSSNAQKARYMGAGRTLISRPWLGEMHITWDGVGEGHMAHELAHLFTRPFGSGPLHLAGSGWLRIDMGLVEGAAEAIAWDSEILTFHGWSAALRRLDLAPHLGDIMGATGFWRQQSRTAYTLMGSLCRWLIDQRGMEAFQRLYGSGDFEDVYGESLEELIEGWGRFLDGLILTPTDLELARFLYDRPSIFGKRCARALAARAERGRELAATNRHAEAAQCLAQNLADDPENPGYQLELAAYLGQSGQYGEARTMASGVRQRQGVGRVLVARAGELEGDIAWLSGDLEQARQHYQAVVDQPWPDADLRRVTVKLLATSDERLEDIAFDILLAVPAPPAAALIHRLTRRSIASPTGLLAYLLGLQLFNAQDYAAAADSLSQAIDLVGRPAGVNERSLAALTHYARLRMGQSLFLSGQPAAARTVFAGIRDQSGPIDVDGRRVQAIDWLERCDWALTR